MRLCLAGLLLSVLSVPAAEPASVRLKEHVERLASDKMKGRGAGMPELEKAGEYIARHFRQIGLQPASAHGFLQPVPVRATVKTAVRVEIEAGGRKLQVGPENIAVTTATPATLASLPVVKVDTAYIRTGPEKSLEGKVAIAASNFPTARLGRPTLAIATSEQMQRFVPLIPAVTPVLASQAQPAGLPGTIVLSADPELAKWAASLPSGPVQGATATGTIEGEQRQFELHNVIGILRGSDPALKDSYVLLSAHYDGLGEVTAGTDRIRNGANDNASGTAALIAIAEKLAKQKPRPRRSIIFAAWSGEEAGGLGAQYYSKLPLIPLAKTIANINIEQVGRYDGEGGAGPKRLMVTGFDYSDLGRTLAEAAKQSGVEIYAGPAGFFARSDNYVLAQAGVPAHTVAASLEFPDYHKVSDSAEKLDYANHALLTEAITQALLGVANSSAVPQWNEKERATEPFRRARAQN